MGSDARSPSSGWSRVDEAAGRPRAWWWLVGAVALGTVVAVGLHLADVREVARLVGRVRPGWLLVAVGLQALTYASQGQVWRGVARAAGARLPFVAAYRLSLAKLFVDQALPSGGIGGTIVVARALEARGLARGVVVAGAVVETTTFYVAYVLCLGAALTVTIVHRQATPLVEWAGVAFGIFAIAVAAMLLAFAGRSTPATRRSLRWLGPLHRAQDLLGEAEPRLVHSARLLGPSTAYQLAIFALDATTVWVMVTALGGSASLPAVFTGYIIASLFRTLGPVPGGLGTFEAASVLALRSVGVELAVALSATLAFRALSFWLPLAPGMLAWRSTLRAGRVGARRDLVEGYWALEPGALMARLATGGEGLAAEEAARRLVAFGSNALHERRPPSRWRALGHQLRSPLLALLVFAAAVSALTGGWTETAIVLGIVLASVVIGFQREYRADTAAAVLGERVRTRCNVVRDGAARSVFAEEVVPGDLVLLAAGSLVPADAVVLEASDCFVSQAVLTGESFPVAKAPGVVAVDATLAQRTNCVFRGSNVRSGTATCVVVATGSDTQVGTTFRRLTLRPPETEFDRGLRRFGTMLTIAMLVAVFVVFAVHVLMGRPTAETLLFAVALAVGLSPELLPAVLSVNLARGASAMARAGVLVRSLDAIENLGSMDVLCTDKTGTLTAGVVELEGAYDPAGTASDDVLRLGGWNAAMQTGLPSPLDDAIVRAARDVGAGVRKRAEIPFDFVRKRVSVVVEDGPAVRLVTKGAFAAVLQACTTCRGAMLDDAARAALTRRYDAWSAQGVRVLAVAARDLPDRPAYGHDDEADLDLVGFLAFTDRPKDGVEVALRDLVALGVSVKVITGDDERVARHVAAQVGLPSARVVSGAALDRLSDEALWRDAERTDLFVEIDPNQKERIIRALRHAGHVVGFLGDGVNDAPAMHAADTSLSVDQAVDVARAAADFVLLERDLGVIRSGIEEGRRTFANTMKYVQITTSANLGNMTSMAVASLFLPFLPLTAGQILLNNFLSDVPALGVADDSVDREMVERPRRWDVRQLGRFMVLFGGLSSLFDLLTFQVLLRVYHAGPALFRTGWFVESLLSELVVALIVRTRRPFFRSRPGRLLFWSTQAIVVVALVLPYVPAARLLGFVPLPWSLLATIVGVILLYVTAAELTKRGFYRPARPSRRPGRGT